MNQKSNSITLTDHEAFNCSSCLTQDMKGKALKVIKDGIEMQPDSSVAEVGECVVRQRSVEIIA
jgi:hypothetical protein